MTLGGRCAPHDVPFLSSVALHSHEDVLEGAFGVYFHGGQRTQRFVWACHCRVSTSQTERKSKATRGLIQRLQRAPTAPTTLVGESCSEITDTGGLSRSKTRRRSLAVAGQKLVADWGREQWVERIRETRRPRAADERQSRNNCTDVNMYFCRDL